MNALATPILSTLLLAVIALADIAPFLDDVIRGVTLGGAAGMLIAYRRYRRGREDRSP